MEQLITIRTLAQLKELEAYLSDKEFVAYDVETTGLEKSDEIIGFSVCADINVGYYVITKYWDVVTQKLIQLETHAAASAFLKTLIGKKLIMQGGGFDVMMTDSNYGVYLMPSLHTDTLVLGHLLNENRLNGLKERGVELYGEDAAQEQREMKESVSKNGGVLTKEKYELYKADADLIARYGAKDAILTLKVFYNDVPILFEEGLDKFFYEDETMPLLRGPTYDLNTTGLKVDPVKLQDLKGSLEAEIAEAEAFIHAEIDMHAPDYPGLKKIKIFNLNSTSQLSWLLFVRLENRFYTLTKGGRALCQALDLRLPYAFRDKVHFIQVIQERKDQVWALASINPKTGKLGRPKKVADYWTYFTVGKQSLQKLSGKYKWVEKLLEYKKAEKLLGTYVEGIQSRMRYGIIRPNFLQHGTTSGRYSCKHPNFQNLPRDDKRVKACIIARPGKVFVGADYSQLEPRVFASLSKDERLLKCFKDKDDFYSVVGVPVFKKYDCTLKKDGSPTFFRTKYVKLGDASKVIALAIPYGAIAPQIANELEIKADMNVSMDEAQDIINDYFEAYPSVHKLMLSLHDQAKKHGVVYNLFGRPRRIPAAMDIVKLYGDAVHSDLPRALRNLLNLAMNHPVQSTGASIMNRAAIAVCAMREELAKEDVRWNQVKIVIQVHDDLALEGPQELEEMMKLVLKTAMEETVQLPGVDLIAEPKAAYSLADLK